MNTAGRVEIVELEVRGMTCEDCGREVGAALKGIPGVEQAAVPDWKARRAVVRLPSAAPSEALVEAVRAAGYGAEVTSRRSAEDGGEGDASRTARGYDLIVIGSGGAGTAAAIRAAECGYRVAVVEAGAVGGTCVNIGCVPSKTLIRAAEAYYRAGHHGFEGVQTRAESVDWRAVLQQKDELVAGLRQTKYLDVLASYENITLVRMRATLRADGSAVLGDGRTLRAGKVIVAAGASPRILSLRGIEEVPVLTSTSLMALARLPKSLLVIGGRAVALELGQAVARFGSRVTILQRGNALLPEHEPEVSEAIERHLAEEGVEIHTGVQPIAIRRDGDETIVTAAAKGAKREYRAERVLMAVGRVPNTGGLGLTEAGIEVDEQGFIIVDEKMRTSNPKVYAAGDVTNNPKLVYVAAAGFTEREARAAGYKVKTSILPLESVPRAKAARDTRGLMKLVADADSGRLLGGHIVAAEGGEIIQTVTLSIKFGISVSDLAGTLFPYLTLGEGIKLAALAFEKDLARLSCCAG